MFITRFLGNFFFALFYVLIIMWAGMRKIVNDQCSIPIVLSYIGFILFALQGIFLFYVKAVSGEFPETGAADSIRCVLSYGIPLVIFGFSPNLLYKLLNGVEAVRRHKAVPILPTPETSDEPI
jgi:hypothetical protein